jgi:hypothetical protein
VLDVSGYNYGLEGCFVGGVGPSTAKSFLRLLVSFKPPMLSEDSWRPVGRTRDLSHIRLILT